MGPSGLPASTWAAHTRGAGAAVTPTAKDAKKAKEGRSKFAEFAYFTPTIPVNSARAGARAWWCGGEILQVASLGLPEIRSWPDRPPRLPHFSCPTRSRSPSRSRSPHGSQEGRAATTPRQYPRGPAQSATHGILADRQPLPTAARSGSRRILDGVRIAPAGPDPSTCRRKPAEVPTRHEGTSASPSPGLRRRHRVPRRADLDVPLGAAKCPVEQRQRGIPGHEDGRTSVIYFACIRSPT